MDTNITVTMEDTRRKLLENFDAEVHDRLKVNMTRSKEYLDRYARMLWAVTKHELGKLGKFDDDYLTFMLKRAPDGVNVPAGSYYMSQHGIDGHRYRLGHPLAQHLLSTAASRKLQRRRNRLRLHGVAADGRRDRAARRKGGHACRAQAIGARRRRSGSHHSGGDDRRRRAP